MIESIVTTTTQLGIVSQLYTNRMNQLLGNHDLNNAQFALLNHLARHHDQPQTLSTLTASMELNQPAISKIINKFLKAGWVSVTKDQQDSRKKWVSITQIGQQLVGEIMQNIGPDILSWFEGWSKDEIEQFGDHLNKLNRWLDENRLSKS